MITLPVTVITGLLLAFAGFIWGLLHNYIKALTKQIDMVKDEIHAMQLDIAKNYVMYQSYEKDMSGNTASHGIMHDKMNNMAERIKALEIVQEHCPACNNK